MTDSFERTEHTVARGHEQGFALGIVLALLGMDRTVELNRQATIGTAEIDDEGPDRMLAPELQTRQPAPAQRAPQNLFPRRLAGAQFSGRQDVIALLAAAGRHLVSVAKLTR